MPDPEDLSRRATAHFDLAWREMTRAHGAVQSSAYMRVMTGEAHPLGNVAIIADASDPATLPEAAQPLAQAAVPAAVFFTAAVPDAARADLVAAGFKPEDPVPAMAVEIDTMPELPLPASCEWLRIGAELAAEFTHTIAAGFELPESLARRFSPEMLGVDPAPSAITQYYAIRCDGVLAATTVLFLADGLAGIYSVATLPAFRRRGLGAYATWRALRSAVPMGYRTGVLQSSAAGYPVYRRLGFRDVGQLSVFIRAMG